MKHFFNLVVAELFTILICCLPASAQQTKQNRSWCANVGGIYSSDFAINACTSIIMDSKETSQSLALVFANRCREFFKENMTTLALQDCNESIWLDRSTPYGFVIRGNVYAKMEKYDRALADYNEAIRLSPDLALAYEGRARLLARAHRYTESVVDFTRAVWLDSKDANAWSGLCWIAALRGDVHQAISNCNEALRLKPDDAKTLIQLGLANLKSGAFRAAINNYTSALKFDSVPAIPLYGRGIAKLKSGDGSGAVDIAEAKYVQSDIAKKFANLYGIRPDGDIVAIPAESNKLSEAALCVMGIVVRPFKTDVGTNLDPPPGHGLLVTQIYDRSPGKSMGIMPGDIIVKIDDHEIRNFIDLSNAISHSTLGRQLAVTFVHMNKQTTKIILVRPARGNRKTRP